MKITKDSQSPSEAATVRDHFNGAVAQELIHQYPGAVRVLMVRFEAGTRTNWHTHDGGQVLHIIEGSGLVRTEGEAVRMVDAGDLVVAEPGEKHWHGAGDATPMVHLAVSVGDTNWLESSADSM